MIINIPQLVCSYTLFISGILLGKYIVQKERKNSAICTIVLMFSLGLLLFFNYVDFGEHEEMISKLFMALLINGLGMLGSYLLVLRNKKEEHPRDIFVPIIIILGLIALYDIVFLINESPINYIINNF